MRHQTTGKAGFQALLRKNGYKATPSRLLVLSILEKRHIPTSAQDIVDIVGGKMDQATVYRIFKDLRIKNIVRQIDLRQNHAHYELTDMADHHHLICIHCGRIEDVNECGVHEMEGAVLHHTKHFSEIKQHSLEFYGICKLCSKNTVNNQ